MELKGKMIDLHLHLDGSLSKKTVRQLADMQSIDIAGDITGLLTVSDNCCDLNEYLEKFEFPLKLLQTKEALTLSIYNLLSELDSQGIVYAEVRFAPQLHLNKQLTQTDVVEAVLQGKQQAETLLNIRSGIILCCMRGSHNTDANMETVSVAAKYLDKGVVAVDLAGAEALYPNEQFTKELSYANRLNIPLTIHAGEADGYNSVRTALEYRPVRIGHGIRAAWDDETMQMLADKGIFLELCPTSNLNTKVVDDIKDYPLMKLLDAGVKVTINTDNMTVSDTTLEQEIRLIAGAFNLSDKQIEGLLINSVEASLSPAALKSELLSKLLTDSVM